MTSGQRYTPTEHWYHPPPDRSAVGQKKIEELHRQLAAMKHDINDKQNMVEKLKRIQEMEQEKRNAEEKVLERNSRQGTPRLLKSEMERLYGKDSPLDRERGSPALDRHVVETMIKHRTKEYSARQQESTLKAKYLDKERLRLQEARRRIEEQRLALLHAQSPTGDQPPEPKELPRVPAQAVNTYINTARKQMPDSLNKIWKLREDMQQHYNYYRKPYNGELGLGSYEPWQIQDYFMCKDIVTDVVEDFLNLYFLHDDVVEKGTYKAMLDEDKLWRQRQTESLAEKRAVHLIAEEMILDETGIIIDDTIKEMHHMYGTFTNMTNLLIMTTAERVATGKQESRDPGDRAYNMVTKGFFSIKENRKNHREDIWGHSQYVQNKVSVRKITRKAGGEEEVQPPEEEGDEEEEEEDFDAPDMTVLDFNTLSLVQTRSLEPSPLDSNEMKREKESFGRYKRRELEYWANMRSRVAELTYDNKKCRGVRLVRTSPNSRFIAAATFHGDVIVYDALMEPLRPFRVNVYAGKKDETITDISWNVDSTRIVVIYSLGQLQIYSVISGPVTNEAAVKLGLPCDTADVYPFELRPLLRLDVNNEDFIFHQGALAEEGVQDDVGLIPERSAFFPSISFLGAQNDMLFSLDNGDLMKCNIQESVKTINPEQEGPNNDSVRIYKPMLTKEDEATDINTIGQNVEAELFRGHKKGIVYIGFVEYLNAMITVDQKGFVYKWKYSSKYKSSFGWYIPSRKFKIETTKKMYKESEKDRPKLVFTDQVIPGKKPRTRQEIAAERRRVQNTLDNMHLGEPWHEEYLEQDGVQLQIFAPRGLIAETGAMFHIVTRDPDSNTLSSYVTQLYKPVPVRCTSIVRIIGSPTSTDLVVVLLFPAYPPKGPHFTVFLIDLRTMTLRDFRRDLLLTAQQFTQLKKKNLISCDISRVLGPTGSDYLFIVFNSDLFGISLTTGQTVVKSGKKPRVKRPPRRRRRRPGDDDDDDQEDDEDEEDDDNQEDEFQGSIVDERLLSVPPHAECTVMSFEGKIRCIVYGRKMPQMYVVTFTDQNKYTDRRAMWKTYTTLQSHKLVPAELRVNTHEWRLDDAQHPAVAVRKMLLRKIDTEMRRAGLLRDHPKIIKRIALSDKVENYKIMNRYVSDTNFLEKDAVMQRRAASRQESATPEVDDEKF